MASSPIKLTIDYSRAIRKIGHLTQDVKDTSNKALNDVGEDGKRYAKSIAPRWSGQTISKIKLLKSKGFEVQINATNILSDGHARKLSRFDLTRWMHTSSRAAKHIKSGDHKFLDSTAEYLRGAAPRLVRVSFDKMTKKYR
jgi:hypothetical protein